MVKRWMKRLVPLLAMMVLFLTGCDFQLAGALAPKGPVAEKQLELILWSLIIMIIVLVVVFVLFFTAVYRFRRRPGDEHKIPEQIEGNHKLEATWTIIPIFLLLIMAIPTVALTFDLEEEAKAEEGQMLIKAVGKQFWWEFTYPEEGIVTAQEVYIPVGEKVVFELSSFDVIHSFWVPELAGKKDANPNSKTINYIYLQADEPGVYKGKCTELCGQSHALMDFKLIAVEKDEYEAWVAGMLDVPSVTAETEVGADLFEQKCLVCHAIDPGMGSVGPNLNGFADRLYIGGFIDNNAENLVDWIKDPVKMKPGVTMPAFGDQLTTDEIDEIVKYLQSLN
jgi:cytochrome c oxidase subunit 2